MYNYTIIIPHHNIPELLQRCIDSIPLRVDVQVIIVDDNSSAEIVDFEKFPGLSRPNTEVYFTKEGKGAGYARNIGLKHASGRWILFADSDDMFDTDLLSNQMDKYLNSSSDLIIFNVDVYDADTMQKISVKTEFKEHLLNNTQIDIDWIRYNFTNPWCKFVKRDLIDSYKINFDEVKAGNDVMFSLKCGFFAEKVLLDKTVIYKWMFRKCGSISSTISKDYVMSKLNVSASANRFIYEHNISSQFRRNLFIIYIPYFKRTGVSLVKSLYEIFRVTEKRYLFRDLYNLCSYTFQKFI